MEDAAEAVAASEGEVVAGASRDRRAEAAVSHVHPEAEATPVPPEEAEGILVRLAEAEVIRGVPALRVPRAAAFLDPVEGTCLVLAAVTSPVQVAGGFHPRRRNARLAEIDRPSQAVPRNCHPAIGRAGPEAIGRPKSLLVQAPPTVPEASGRAAAPRNDLPNSPGRLVAEPALPIGPGPNQDNAPARVIWETSLGAQVAPPRETRSGAHWGIALRSFQQTAQASAVVSAPVSGESTPVLATVPASASGPAPVSDPLPASARSARNSGQIGTNALRGAVINGSSA